MLAGLVLRPTGRLQLPGRLPDEPPLQVLHHVQRRLLRIQEVLPLPGVPRALRGLRHRSVGERYVHLDSSRFDPKMQFKLTKRACKKNS